MGLAEYKDTILCESLIKNRFCRNTELFFFEYQFSG